MGVFTYRRMRDHPLGRDSALGFTGDMAGPVHEQFGQPPIRATRLAFIGTLGTFHDRPITA